MEDRTTYPQPHDEQAVAAVIRWLAAQSATIEVMRNGGVLGRVVKPTTNDGLVLVIAPPQKRTQILITGSEMATATIEPDHLQLTLTSGDELTLRVVS